MKSKYDWFDDNWNPDVKLSTIILELLLSPTYRRPMRVTEVHIYKDETTCAQCPRCKGSIEYEYQLFCGSCGQHLDQFKFEDAKEVYIGWIGPKDDDEEDEEEIDCEPRSPVAPESGPVCPSISQIREQVSLVMSFF